MKKINYLILVLVFVFSFNIDTFAYAYNDRNYYTVQEVCGGDTVTSDCYLKLIDYMSKADNILLLCVYGDPKISNANEQKKIHYAVKYASTEKFGNIDGYGWNTDNESLFNTPNYGKQNVFGRVFSYEDLDAVVSGSSCPEKLYYICSTNSYNESSKYYNVNQCWYSKDGVIDAQTLKSKYPETTKEFSGQTFSGEWVLNEDISVNNMYQEVSSYVTLDRNEKLSVQATPNALNNGKVKVTTKKDKEITIKNLEEYKDEFVNKTENYPKYLIKKQDSNEYEFVTELVDSDNKKIEYKELYVSVLQLNEVHGLSKEKTYKYCEDLLGGKDSDVMNFLKTYVFKVIWIGIPIILILLTTIDFSKVIFSDDKEGIKNAFKRFTKRAIISVLIFLTPTIIILISNLVGANGIDDCVKTINNMEEVDSNQK